MALTAMEEAFKKSGLVNETEIQDRENARLKAIREEKKIENKKRMEVQKEQRRQNEEVLKKYKPFDDRWKDIGKQKFMTHLIFSFVPGDVPHYAWTNEELKEKKCCICGQALISKDFIFKHLDKFVSIGIEQLKGYAGGEEIRPRQEFEKEFGDVVLGVVSHKSSAAFCGACFNDFYAWIEYMLLRGNTQINRIITRRRKETSLPESELGEYEEIRKIKDANERQLKLDAFFKRIQSEKGEKASNQEQ